MTFLNWPILLALGGVAIPILIHLFNRRQAQPMDWGAMRFLLASLTSRKRRILIEEVLLMSLRCMLVALLVLAIARPYLPSRGAVPWSVVLPAILAAAVCAGIGSAMWSRRTARLALLWTAAMLLLIAAISCAVEYWVQESQRSGGSRDLAIVIDASASMTLTSDGKDNFQRAVDEARSLIKGMGRSDAAAIILAGAAVRQVVPSPISDTDELMDALEDLKPLGAAMDPLGAITAATACLARGNNPAKAVVIITDGQKLGWDPTNGARWRFVAAGFGPMPSPPKLLCRILRRPQVIDNAAITGITFSRQVVGTDRPVDIRVKLLNAGTVQIASLSVQLAVDGADLGAEAAVEVPPGTEGAVNFQHRFERPGPHVVAARIVRNDDLPGDNEAHRVLRVFEKLPVLIVDGAPGRRAARFIRTAMAPGIDEAGRYLISPTVIGAPEIVDRGDFAQYRVVVLADVPRLPRSVAERLARFVAHGGGLLVAPGKQAVPDFYNEWTGPSGKPLMPAVLLERRVEPDSPARPAVSTFRHPALSVVADLTHWDTDKAAVSAWWRLAANPRDRSVSVAGEFSNAEPMVVERSVGKGYVLMTAMALHGDESNLPRLECFPPMVHELTYYLASPRGHDANVAPASAVRLELAVDGPEKPNIRVATGQSVTVVTPDGQRHEIDTPAEGVPPGVLRLAFDRTDSPGLYRFVLPDSVAGHFAAGTTDGKTVPFAVLPDAKESDLQRLSEEDVTALGRHEDFFAARSFSDLEKAVRGQVPGEELWKYLALGALIMIIGEVGLTRWISWQRRARTVKPVDFGQQGVDAEVLRAHAREILAGPRA